MESDQPHVSRSSTGRNPTATVRMFCLLVAIPFLGLLPTNQANGFQRRSLGIAKSAGEGLDRKFFLELWKRLESDQENQAESAQPVTVSELESQPDAWPGKYVRIAGNLYAVKKVEFDPGSIVGSGHYYESWISDHENLGKVYCVYSREAPEFSDPGSKFTLVEKPVEVTGYFFKIRAYTDSQAKLNHCPLILSKSVAAGSQPISAMLTQLGLPSLWVIVASLLLLSVLAIVIGNGIKRGRKKVDSPGCESQETVDIVV